MGLLLTTDDPQGGLRFRPRDTPDHRRDRRFRGRRDGGPGQRGGSGPKHVAVALAATALIVFAAWAPSTEVAKGAAGERRVLLLATSEVTQGPPSGSPRRARRRRCSPVDPGVPSDRLERWLSAEDDASGGGPASARALGGALVAGSVSGSLGDPDPAQALEDEPGLCRDEILLAEVTTTPWPRSGPTGPVDAGSARPSRARCCAPDQERHQPEAPRGMQPPAAPRPRPPASIRFFPFFCFSSSFRFRVTSPP